MAKHGEGLGYEIVKAVHNGEIEEPITFHKVKSFCSQKGLNVSDNHMRSILSNSTENTHSPTYKKYFIRLGSVGSGRYTIAPEYRKQIKYYWLNIDTEYYDWSFSNMKVGGREDYSNLTEDGKKRKNPLCFKNIQIGDNVLAYETGEKAITAICNVVDKKNEENDEINVVFEKRKSFDDFLTLDQMKNSEILEGCGVINFHRGTLFQIEKKYYDEIIRMLGLLNDSENKFYNEVQEVRKIGREKRQKVLAERTDTKPKEHEVTRTEYMRSPYVVVEVLDRAKGICEKCNSKAPFIRASDGTPYLEVHHKIQLCYGGEDTVENAIAVCPNCHRELHFGM